MTAVAAALGPQLQELGLPGCRGVADAGVGALQVATNLRTLNLASNRGLTGRCVCFYVSGVALFPLSGAVDGMVQLSWHACLTRSPHSVSPFALRMPASYPCCHCCWCLCRSLQQLFPALSRLRSLSLALCGGLEDEGLAACAAAPRLSNLDLHCCWRLTDAGGVVPCYRCSLVSYSL